MHLQAQHDSCALSCHVCLVLNTVLVHCSCLLSSSSSSSSSSSFNVFCFAGDETDGYQLIPEADGGDHESRDQRDGHLSHGLL